jgi:murein DD-endopeptidase MepM/ murein hydrolase activator NlpD
MRKWRDTFRFRRAALAMACLSTIPAVAAVTYRVIGQPSDQDQSIFVRRVLVGNRVDLVVENHKLHDVTLMLSITADNTTISRPKPQTATYPAQSQTVAAQLFATDSSKRANMRFHFAWVMGSMHAKHDDRVIYSLPFESGTSYWVIEGYNGSLSHKGSDQYAVDFAMPEGTVVCAARDGLVVDVRADSKDGGLTEEHSDEANYVFILHDDGTIGEYLHLQYDGVLVKLGQRVTAGMPIARSGNTGYSAQPHLHFGVYSAVDGTHLRSHPVTFTLRQGTITDPIRGRFYTAK